MIAYQKPQIRVMEGKVIFVLVVTEDKKVHLVIDGLM